MVHEPSGQWGSGRRCQSGHMSKAMSRSSRSLRSTWWPRARQTLADVGTNHELYLVFHLHQLYDTHLSFWFCELALISTIDAATPIAGRKKCPPTPFRPPHDSSIPRKHQISLRTETAQIDVRTSSHVDSFHVARDRVIGHKVQTKGLKNPRPKQRCRRLWVDREIERKQSTLRYHPPQPLPRLPSPSPSPRPRWCCHRASPSA